MVLPWAAETNFLLPRRFVKAVLIFSAAAQVAKLGKHRHVRKYIVRMKIVKLSKGKFERSCTVHTSRK